MKDNVNSLDELNKGACMGIDAILYILDKVENKKLKKLLETDYFKYKEITEKVKELYPKYNEKKEPHKTNSLTKAMTYYDIEMKTLTDKSDSKIAELLLKGTNMGIIEGVKLLNNKEITKDVRDLIQEFVAMQENEVEYIKRYL